MGGAKTKKQQQKKNKNSQRTKMRHLDGESTNQTEQQGCTNELNPHRHTERSEQAVGRHLAATCFTIMSPPRLVRYDRRCRHDEGVEGKAYGVWTCGFAFVSSRMIQPPPQLLLERKLVQNLYERETTLNQAANSSVVRYCVVK
ncbi:hypothetical protein KIN20_027606 [Parelaphostrongylus tenuis]|uniref:Uncharacterized protein n=1 Tax=Parelaphostrongylus tenuis TaxID=148309 RepID=A0AAD5WE30_PARTN|nr:hypothetical protein KIN20_027606 [Parelaphostrongylus tenuis]